MCSGNFEIGNGTEKALLVSRYVILTLISGTETYIHDGNTSNNTSIRFRPLATLNTLCTLLFSWFLILADAGTETLAVPK